MAVMGPRQRIRPYVAISIFIHLTLLIFLLTMKRAPTGESNVDFVDLVDIPRATDLALPEPGVIKSRPRLKPSPTVPSKNEERVMEGRVPDLPVNPDVMPEKSFPQPAPETEKKAKRSPKNGEGESMAKGKIQKGGGKEKVPRIKDLTPSLGKMVLAARTKQNKGPGKGTGENKGTRGEPAKEGDFSETSEGGTVLTPLDSPSIQYISYFASIKRKIELVWHYPFDAVQKGIQGNAVVDFAIKRNGNLKTAVLRKSSGSNLLDKEAVNAIKNAAPFTPIPEQYDIEELRIRANFIYEMNFLNIK